MLAIQRFLYLIFVACTAFTAFYYFLAHSQSIWLVWSALLFSLIIAGNTFVQRVLIISLTGLIAALFVLGASFVANWLFLLAISLFIITVGGCIISKRYPDFLFSIFMINIFAILSGCLRVSSAEMMERGLFVLLGTAIAVFFQLLFLYKFKVYAYRALIDHTLQQFKFLCDEIFSCFINVAYVDNIYLFERRLHVQKNNVLQAMGKLKEASKVGQDAEKHALIYLLDDLFSILITSAALRRRITDYSIVELCKQEFIQLKKALDQSFSFLMDAFKGKRHTGSNDLAINIKLFEDHYQNVLRVTAREPLVFLLFIAALHDLQNQMQELNQWAIDI